MMVTYNSLDILGFIMTFLPFVAPLMLPFISLEYLFRVVFVDIHSTGLLGFSMVYMICSIIHVSRMHMTSVVVADHSKRGTSLMHMLISKYSEIGEYFVTGIVEPVLIASVGYLIYLSTADTWFFAFMLLSASCLFIQDTADKIYQHRFSN